MGEGTMSEQAPYELYRVITDYEALQDGFLDRIEDLDTTFEQIEMAGELPKGYAAKLLCKSQKRVVKALGPHSLGKMLKGTGLVLALVVDDARFAAQKADLIKRRRAPNREQLPAGSSRLLKGKITPKISRKLQILRNEKLSPQQRRRIAKRAGKASGKSRRLRSRLKQMQALSCKNREHGALLAPAVAPSCADVQAAITEPCRCP
jgi:hypothetical protein